MDNLEKYPLSKDEYVTEIKRLHCLLDKTESSLIKTNEYYEKLFIKVMLMLGGLLLLCLYFLIMDIIFF